MIDGRLELHVSELQTIGDRPVRLILQSGVSGSAERLIWNEFFTSRGRGIDWATHLPWAVEGTALCAHAIVVDATVAALLLRRVPGTTTAMIGYVCVDPAFRGHGLSSRLIELTCEPLRRTGFDHLLLWTGKPAVYERVGFRTVAREDRWTLRPRSDLATATMSLLPWPGSDGVDTPGLPPFASAAWQASSDDARIVFADTPMGATLLDHAGAPDAVMRIMAATRTGDWSATLPSGHPLAGRAQEREWCRKEAPGPLTMYRALTAAAEPPAPVPPAYRI